MDVDSVTGCSWDKLFPSCNELPIAKEGNPPILDPNANWPPEHAMLIFGRRPETDPFYTLVCDICGKILMPAAMSNHLKRHGDGLLSLKTKHSPRSTICLKKLAKSDSQSPSETLVEDTRTICDIENVTCSACSVTIPSTAFRRHVLKVHNDDPSLKPLMMANIKTKTVKKPSPLKKSNSKCSSVSPPDLTEEVSKDIRKIAKNKKCKSPIPPELELILPAAKRIGASTGPPELYPIDLPKKSKKKVERKAERIYDPNKNCGVINDAGKPCLRTILCKAHLVAQKRAVLNRAMPYDALTKLYKSQNEEDWKSKVELCLPMESLSVTKPSVTTSEIWTESNFVEPLEPSVKRCKTVEIEEDHYTDLPSDDDALIEATLKDLEDHEPEPLLRWSLEAPVCATSAPHPPMYFLPNLPWHATHPKPLATNTFGCRLVGGLMTKCKKLDAFRKHVQSVWGGQNSIDSGSKFVGFTTKGGVTMKKSDSHKRKRKGSGSEIVSGLLQRSAVTTNGVNRGHFPVVPSNPASFIKLKL